MGQPFAHHQVATEDVVALHASIPDCAAVQEILSRQRDPGLLIITEHPGTGEMALHAACRERCLGCLEALVGALAQSNPGGMDTLADTLSLRSARRRLSPLSLAASRGWAPGAALLVDMGVDPARRGGRDGRTTLHHAAAGGHAVCIEAVLAAQRRVAARRSCYACSGVWQGPAARRATPPRGPRVEDSETASLLELRDYNGMTALHLAAAVGAGDAVAALLAAGADAEARTSPGDGADPGSPPPRLTPLHLAAAGLHEQAALRLLLAHEAQRALPRPRTQPSPPDLRALRDGAGRTPLELAFLRNAELCLLCLLDSQQSVAAAVQEFYAARNATRAGTAPAGGTVPGDEGLAAREAIRFRLLEQLQRLQETAGGEAVLAVPKVAERCGETSGDSSPISQLSRVPSGAPQQPPSSHGTSRADSVGELTEEGTEAVVADLAGLRLDTDTTSVCEATATVSERAEATPGTSPTPRPPEPVMTCPICLDRPAAVCLSPCSHALCKPCLFAMLQQPVPAPSQLRCPLCRAGMQGMDWCVLPPR